MSTEIRYMWTTQHTVNTKLANQLLTTPETAEQSIAQTIVGTVEWDALAGPWTLINTRSYNGDRTLTPRCKGSSATEDISIWKITVQLIIS